jgi:MFS family permease
MVFSVLTYALFTGVCGLAGQAWHLAVLRFLAALGMGGEWSLGVALVMESWGAHARAVLAGLIGAASNVGFLLAAALSAALPPADFWRVLLIVCVFPALLTFLLRVFVPESARWEHAVATGPKARVADIFRGGLGRRSILGAGLGAVALLPTWGAVQWIPLWVGQMPSTDARDPARAQLCSALGAVLGSFLGAVVGDRFGRRLGYFSLCLASLAVCQYLFLTYTSFDGGFLATVFLAGALSAAFYGWLPLYLPELFPTRVRATGQGFCYNSGRLLAAVGVLVNTSINLRGYYAEACAVICLVYVVGLVLAWLIPETKGQPLPE